MFIKAFLVFCLPILSLHAALPSDFLERLVELGEPLTKNILIINVSEQKLLHFQGNTLLATYLISTGKNGTGQEQNSFQTPLGMHRIAKKIGEHAALNSIFVERVNTGKVWKGEFIDKDLVLTRILWLEGLEKGFNQGISRTGKVVDTFKRYIYIHGTNVEESIGMPVSKGCIRMRNDDVLTLFPLVDQGSLVYIAN